MRRLRSIAALMLACGAVAAEAGEIAGTVIDADSGKPLQHARVRVTISKGRELHPDAIAVMTGEDGYFRFGGLPESACEVRAEKAGYREWGRVETLRVRQDGSPVPVTLRLTPVGGLTVRVVDESGVAVDGAQVAVVERGDQPSYAANSKLGWAGGGGVYRFFLARGSYRVAVVSPGSGTLLRARDQTFLMTYYPGTADVSRAAWLRVTPGKEVAAEVRVTPIPARQIRGRLGFSGRLVQLFVYPADKGSVGLAQINEDTGEFRIFGLAPGIYELQANTSAGMLYKTVQVSDTDVDGVVISEGDKGARK